MIFGVCALQGSSFERTIVDQLTGDDLARLSREYSEHRAKWKLIGVELGMTIGDLDAIAEYNRTSSQCFLELLKKWVNQGGKTENELNHAVRRSSSKVTKRTSCRSKSLIISVCIVFVAIAATSTCGYFYYTTATARDPLITVADNLKEQYKNQQVVKSTPPGFIDYATNTPFFNVMIKMNEAFIPVWYFIESIDYLSQKLGQKRHLISGHPGAGKTTLMQWLATVWAEGQALQSCQILFLIHLDSLSKESKPQSLSDLLHMSVQKDLGDLKNIAEEIQSSNGAGACFLLDAYDGWPWKDDFVFKLFFGNALKSSICIMTSHPKTYHEEISRGEINVIEIVTDSPLTKTANNLKVDYKNQQLLKNMPDGLVSTSYFFNVTIKTNKEFIPVWTFIESIDSLSQNGQRRHLISGHPGAGKTTLMRHLAKKWAEGEALQSCQILFLIHLDEFLIDPKPKSLSGLFEMSYKGIVDEQVSKEIENSHGAGTCFLLDAYDEWNSKEDDFVYKLFLETNFTLRYVY